RAGATRGAAPGDGVRLSADRANVRSRASGAPVRRTGVPRAGGQAGPDAGDRPGLGDPRRVRADATPGERARPAHTPGDQVALRGRALVASRLHPTTPCGSGSTMVNQHTM